MGLFGDGKRGVSGNVKKMLKEISAFIKWIPAATFQAAEVDEEVFTLLLSGVSTCRVMPGIPEHMSYATMYVCDGEENARAARAHMKEMYGVTDEASLVAAAADLFHAQEEYEQFETFWSGRPLFRANELALREKEFFEACKDFAERLRPFVSHRGFFAWDCNEKIGLYRKAYACGLIDEEAFWRLSIPLTERALALYDDWKNYAISCLCGGAYFMFCAQEGDDDVLRFMKINRTLLEHLMDADGAWSRYEWFRSDFQEFTAEELPELDMLPEVESFSAELTAAGEEREEAEQEMEAETEKGEIESAEAEGEEIEEGITEEEAQAEAEEETEPEGPNDDEGEQEEPQIYKRM